MGNITIDAWKRDLLRELDGFRLDVNGWLQLDQALDRALGRIYASRLPRHADCDEAIRANHELMVRYRTAISFAADHLEKPGNLDKLRQGALRVLREALQYEPQQAKPAAPPGTQPTPPGRP